MTANKTYGDANDMIWCILTHNRSKEADFPGTRGVFNIKVVNQSDVAKAAKYCIDMGEEPSSKERFSNFLLTERESLTAQEMKTIATWSSCT